MSQSKSAGREIVIAGGGFGGVRAALKLSRTANNVTLISSSDRFAYFPQMYHAATGGSRSESAIPMTELISGTGIKLVVDTVVKLDADDHRLTGASSHVYKYDKLILALGSVTNYFGIGGLEEFSYDIKSITGAEEFKRHLHQELVVDKKADLNYVVVGGGPTGVELSGALGPYLKRITRLHGLNHPKYDIVLIEAAPRVLPRSPESASARVQSRLESIGVKVMTGTAVQGETARELHLAGQQLSTKTVVWTAGIANNPFYKLNKDQFTLDQRGHVQVDDHLQSRADIYVIGDNAAIQYAGMAQSAISHADYVARDINRMLGRKNRPAYKPTEPISVIPVGDSWAVAQWGKLAMYGAPGSWLRRLADLVGYADIERWPKAVRIWLSDSRREDNCAICDDGESQSAASTVTGSD